jgi:hypothetical protein
MRKGRVFTALALFLAIDTVSVAADGHSLVTLRSLGGVALIERVRALNNC